MTLRELLAPTSAPPGSLTWWDVANATIRGAAAYGALTLSAELLGKSAIEHWGDNYGFAVASMLTVVAVGITQYLRGPTPDPAPPPEPTPPPAPTPVPPPTPPTPPPAPASKS